jgi:hypothetical protein
MSGGTWPAKLDDKSSERLWLGRQMLMRACYPNHDPVIRTPGGLVTDATSKERGRLDAVRPGPSRTLCTAAVEVASMYPFPVWSLSMSLRPRIY